MFSSGTTYEDINMLLKPEEAKTWQIGFNSFKHGLFSDNDFWFKGTFIMRAMLMIISTIKICF